MKIVVLIISAFVLSSCSTISKEGCQTANWYKLGETDALNGKSAKVFVDYKKACGQHGLAVDQENYTSGRVAGLRVFCTYDRGQRFGQEGGTYKGVCPPKVETEFLKGYRIGKREYEIEQKEKELERRKQELEEQEAKLRSRQAILSSLNTKQCTFNSDCTIEGDCSFGKCKRGGAKCSFDSDCATEGKCSLETACVGGHCDTINMCI